MKSETCVTPFTLLHKKLKNKILKNENREQNVKMRKDLMNRQYKNMSVEINSDMNIKNSYKIQRTPVSYVKKPKLIEKGHLRSSILSPNLTMKHRLILTNRISNIPMKRTKRLRGNLSNSKKLIHSLSEFKERKSFDIPNKQRKPLVFNRHKPSRNLKTSGNSIIKRHSKNSSNMNYLRRISMSHIQYKNLTYCNELKAITENTKDTVISLYNCRIKMRACLVLVQFQTLIVYLVDN